MSAETLRRASVRIRRELCYGGSGHEFYGAIADWLMSVEDDPNVDFDLINSEGYCALKVARAYLGSEADSTWCDHCDAHQDHPTYLHRGYL